MSRILNLFWQSLSIEHRVVPGTKRRSRPRTSAPKGARTPLVEGLEPRLLMSAKSLGEPAKGLEDQVLTSVVATMPSRGEEPASESVTTPPLVKEAPPLPAPTDDVVRVSTVSQLQAAVRDAQPNSTILIEPGTYHLSATLFLRGVDDVSIRGATGDRDDVVLVGRGMRNAGYGNVPHGVLVENARNVQIADLTIRDVWYHPISFNRGTESPHVYNVRLVDAGQQFIKANPDGQGGGVDNGVVEYSVMEYTTTARSYYTNGVDVHRGTGWVIRDNVFRNIRGPEGDRVAGPAVLMWNRSRDTITEGNLFLNVERAIAYGLLDNRPDDHAGGVIRNNFIYRAPDERGDVGIGLNNSAGTEVLHNTVVLSGTYPNAIEYRFAATTGAEIHNNLTDAAIIRRNGATAEVSGNIIGADASWFVDASAGDLHLTSAAAAAIDQAHTDAGVRTDYDGDVRPAGAAADVGADEYFATAGDIDFSALPVVRYFSPSQDKTGPVTVEDDGATLHLTGNRWKAVPYRYTVTPNTVLEFEFQSRQEGDIHAIGLDTNLRPEPQRFFRLDGTQEWGVADFADYAEDAPGVRTYRIPIGEFYTGTFNYIAFANDHDVARPDAESIFSNVRLYERGRE